ncbi:hypothetical protein COV17_03825 [Candidatus Woesearchaeota archaeon CG10_big_fil_rev_8_21_14_0_10_36_11]|nr:MAG: hypothetical protein COV17_03825 [Candidatus Woesearchaeota archaeon CG10_big_fil_rev_8_21_14_0_10_36_11]
MFCTTCGSLLVPKSTPYGKWMGCPNGHSQPEVVQKAETTTEKNTVKEKITVGNDINYLAVNDHICTRCGHDKAEMVEIGSFYSDEDSVVKMKCGKCRHIERLEGKIT